MDFIIELIGEIISEKVGSDNSKTQTVGFLLLMALLFILSVILFTVGCVMSNTAMIIVGSIIFLLVAVVAICCLIAIKEKK